MFNNSLNHPIYKYCVVNENYLILLEKQNMNDANYG